jgi:hypothetical protein
MKKFIHIKVTFSGHLSTPHWFKNEQNFSTQMLCRCLVASLRAEPIKVSAHGPTLNGATTKACVSKRSLCTFFLA